jgi:hypothetical protein
MPRPSIELADVMGDAGSTFTIRNQPWLTWLHVQVRVAILRCRTALRGGPVDACSRCGHPAIRYNSCRNRHGPRCQTHARDRWIEARRRDLLPCPYAQVVFPIHPALAPLGLQNQAVV